MANTTFNGPVRSQNGFQTVFKDPSTGEVFVDASFGKEVVLGVEFVNNSQALTNCAYTEVIQIESNAQLTLANGTVGQIKVITKDQDYGPTDAVLTLDRTIGSYTTITFANIGDSAMLVYTSYGWAIISLYGAVAA
tara:strand:- start:478 stop:885 length:408 start_codon:yes stop_codon:yes gene_type:complete